jgi:hypothetical protein
MERRSKMYLNPTWEYVADSVTGGVSNCGIQRERHHDCKVSVFYGDVSFYCNGGFIQIPCYLGASATAFEATEWIGLELEVSGNGEQYVISLRTDQLTRP